MNLDVKRYGFKFNDNIENVEWTRDNYMLLFAVFAKKVVEKDRLGDREKKRESEKETHQEKIQITHMRTKPKLNKMKSKQIHAKRWANSRKIQTI